MTRYPSGVYSIVNRFSSSGIPAYIIIDNEICEVNFDTMLVITSYQGLYYNPTLAETYYNNTGIQVRKLSTNPNVIIGNTSTFTQ